jgi:hypothetical protein
MEQRKKEVKGVSKGKEGKGKEEWERGQRCTHREAQGARRVGWLVCTFTACVLCGRACHVE